MSRQLAEDIIRASVERCESMFGSDFDYSHPVSQMSQIALRSIDRTDVYIIIEPYLYTWGRMGRVLGRSKFDGWQGKVANLVRLEASKLEHLRTLELEQVPLEGRRAQIVELFDSFQAIVLGIAAGKVLHLICPAFFPLWDNAIASGMLAESKLSLHDPISGQDYFEFMRGVQSMLRKRSKLWIELSTGYRKGTLKIVDEYLWWTVRRPFSLVV